MTSILDILNELDATSSRLKKEEIIEKHRDNVLFQRVLHLSMDPRLNFYINKTPTERFKSIDSQPTLNDALDFAEFVLNTRKLTGNAAKVEYATYLGSLPADDAIVFERVIKRDLRCGVKIPTVNKIFGDDWVYVHPVLLCDKQSDKSIARVFKSRKTYCQLKSDGARATISVYEDKIVVHSRSGEVLDFKGHFDYLLNVPAAIGYVFDGELLVRSEKGGAIDRKASNGIINKIHNNTASKSELDRVYLTAWDMIPLNEFVTKTKSSEDYETRFEKNLTQFIEENPSDHMQLIESKIVKTWEEASAIISAWMLNGEEGGVLKTAEMRWENARSKDCVKVKAELTADLMVVGVELGRENKQFAGMLGALIAETSCGSLRVSVGGGYSEYDRATFLGTDSGRVEFYKKYGPDSDSKKFFNIDGIFDKTRFLDSLPPFNESEICQLNYKIIEVIYNATIKSKGKDKASLFLPRFVKIRIDKTEANSMKELN